MCDLKLDEQLCFPFYALSRKITALYKPFLEVLNLTYPQYLAMMVLWEASPICVRDLGEKLWLDSGTLTPLLKRLEEKGLISRNRAKDDERMLLVSLTPLGLSLKTQALEIPENMQQCINAKQSPGLELDVLHRQLRLLLNSFESV